MKKILFIAALHLAVSGFSQDTLHINIPATFIKKLQDRQDKLGKDSAKRLRADLEARFAKEFARGVSFISMETPKGLVNKVNKAFALEFTPDTNSVKLYVDNQVWVRGVHFTFLKANTKEIRCVQAPGLYIRADYLTK